MVLFVLACREHQDAYEFFTRLQDSVDEHLRGQQRPRAIHAALGGTFAQLITVIEAPQHRSERVSAASAGAPRCAWACGWDGWRCLLLRRGLRTWMHVDALRAGLHGLRLLLLLKACLPHPLLPTHCPPRLAPCTLQLQDEEFYQISLDVRGKRTLAESLDSYVSKELMDGQNQYLCEELGKKVGGAGRGGTGRGGAAHGAWVDG